MSEQEKTECSDTEKSSRCRFFRWPKRWFGILFGWFWSKKFWKRFGIVALIVGLLAWWNLFRERRLVISPATTVVTEPRTADGQFIDFTEWFRQNRPPEMLTDDNAARILVRELCPNMENLLRPEYTAADMAHRRKTRSAVYRELGLDPDIPETTRFTDVYGDYEKRLRVRFPETDQPDPPEFMTLRNHFSNAQYLERPLIDEDFSRDWIARNNPALDIIVEASHAKIYKYPFSLPNLDEWGTSYPDWPLGIIFLLPCIQESRAYGRGLAFRAAWRIHLGDMDGAISDILACRRLGQKLGEKSDFLVESLVGIAIAGIATGISPGGNPDVEPTREEWQRLFDAVTAEPNNFDIQRIVREKERKTHIDLIAHIAVEPRWLPRLRFFCKVRSAIASMSSLSGEGGGLSPSNWSLVTLLAGFGFDWNTVMVEYNRLYDEWMDYPERLGASFEAANKNGWRNFGLLRLQSRSKLLAEVMMVVLVRGIDAAREAERRSDCCWQMQRIALAMQLYRADHDGHLPPAFTTDENGKPLHSWRVLLLPYLGYEILYRRIKLDEPWNSAHNRQFHAENIPAYRCPSANRPLKTEWIAEGETSYGVIVGPDTLFSADGGVGIDPAKLRRDEPTREIEKMLLVVERRGGSPWMKPDTEIAQQNGLGWEAPAKELRDRPDSDRIGSRHYAGFNGASYGGSVRFYSELTPPLDLFSFVTGRKLPEESPPAAE